MAKKETNDGQANVLIDKVHGNRDFAAIGRFIEILKFVAEKRGTEVVIIEPEYFTTQSHFYNNMVTQHDRSKLKWTCDKCNNIWDQDVKQLLICILL